MFYNEYGEPDYIDLDELNEEDPVDFSSLDSEYCDKECLEELYYLYDNAVYRMGKESEFDSPAQLRQEMNFQIAAEVVYRFCSSYEYSKIAGRVFAKNSYSD